MHPAANAACEADRPSFIKEWLKQLVRNRLCDPGIAARNREWEKILGGDVSMHAREGWL